MNYVYFENRKYQILPYSQMFNFCNRLCVKKLDSNCIFFVNCEKNNFLKFVKENKLKFFIDNTKNEELYIKKFLFYEYVVYYKCGFLVMETPIKYRFLTEVGNKYFGIEIYILDAIKDISGCDENIGYCTELDKPLPFREEYLETKKCLKNNCDINISNNDKFCYCKKHLIFKSLKYWLLHRYENELEWSPEIPIEIY